MSQPNTNRSYIKRSTLLRTSHKQQGTLQNNHHKTESHTEPSDENRDTLILVSPDVPVVPPTHVVHNVGHYVTRSSKLTLPTFSADPFPFQTFWDSFEAAVHNNEGLTGYRNYYLWT